MVEWKKIWEVTTWDKRFSGIDKNMQPQTIKYHYYLANELTELERQDGDIRILYTTERIAFADSTEVEANISEGEVVTIPWGGNVSIKYFKGKFITADNRIATSNDTDFLSNKYLYYWMLSQKDEIGKFYRGAGIQHPSMYKVLTFPIPIPSLSEQKRIVGILDTFTDSIENLKQQIAQRRKQYEHYREKLLTNVDREDTNWKELSEIADLYKGTYVTKKESNEGAFPVVMGGQKVAYYIDKYNSEGESIVISRSGINAGYVSFWNQPIFVSDGYRIDTNEKVIKKYLFYFLKSREGQINSSKKGAGVPHIQSKYLLSILVPLPPLSEQQRIVSILDTFEASISNLEAQLEQRQKQYEYYRNKLLSFEKEEH